MISGWGVLDPLLRYHLAKKAGNAELMENHHAFWGTEAVMSEGSIPAILDGKQSLLYKQHYDRQADAWVMRLA
ncbi:MAG: YebV family protein [Serratia marcescens]|nr:YebV family protein [Serratia marcescens]